MSRSEATWQTLHAVDLLQTFSATRDHCYYESDPITSRLIGHDPSAGQVLAWGVGAAVLHSLVSDALRKRDSPKWVRAAWDITTISRTGYTIANNHQNGIRVDGANQPVQGCSGSIPPVY